MTTFKQVQLINFMLAQHPHLYVEYVQQDNGYRLRGNNNVRPCTNNIDELLSDIWRALGNCTAPLYGWNSTTEFMRVRTRVADGGRAAFDIAYSNIRGATDGGNIIYDLTNFFNDDDLRTVQARRYVNTKRFKALRALLRGWNSREFKIEYRGRVAILPYEKVDAA